MSKKLPTIQKFGGCEDTHNDVRGWKVEKVEVDGGSHVLVAQDHSNHQEVTGHPQHEDGSIQAEEYHLHPMLVYVELLVPAHLVSVEE